MLDLFAAM